jgi:hypothetical protein
MGSYNTQATITIDRETKDALRSVIALLAIKRNRKITYDEAVSEAIEILRNDAETPISESSLTLGDSQTE